MKTTDLSPWRIRQASACDLNDFSTQPEGAWLLAEDEVRKQTQKLSA